MNSEVFAAADISFFKGDDEIEPEAEVEVQIDMDGLDAEGAQARFEAYQGAKIRPGMIFTIEPGLYFREDDMLIPPEYRGIGIRIEDDVLMTEHGPEWLSAGIPKQIDDVEAWMAERARA